MYFVHEIYMNINRQKKIVKDDYIKYYQEKIVKL